MAEKEIIKMLIEGGKATPSPAIALKLSSYKLNINEVLKQVNEKTKEYEGIQVPVKIVIDKGKKEYSIEVGIPPVSSLIKKELGITKNEKKETIAQKGEKEIVSLGNLTMEQCVKIAKIKMKDMLAKDLKSAVKTVVGTAVSMPVTIEGKKPKEILKEIDEGIWDSKIV